MTERFDIVVLGAGPGGGAAAAACIRAGLSVALVEDYGFGGTCPLRGCNPKKALLAAPEALHLAEGLLESGVAALPELSWQGMARLRASFVDGRAESIREAYAELGIETVSGRGRFIDRERIEVALHEGGTRTLGFGHAVVAVGQRPRPLSEPGAGLLSSSDDFLALRNLPRRLVFVGGGYISFEFAHAARRAGAEVAIVHRSARPLKGFDPDMVQVLLTATAEAGIDVRLDAPLHSVRREKDGLVVRAGRDGATELACDMAVHGAGRVADLDGLGLDAAGVAFSEQGIRVASTMRSVSNPHIYAVGDCCRTPYPLTPTADMQGRVAAANIAAGEEKEVDYRGVPRVCFSLPPICAVGESEEELVQRGVPFEKKEHGLADSFSWKRLGQRHAASKLLVEPGGGAVLGAHMVGHGAEELANLFALAVRQRIPARELAHLPLAYPTLGYYLRYMVG